MTQTVFRMPAAAPFIIEGSLFRRSGSTTLESAGDRMPLSRSSRRYDIGGEYDFPDVRCPMQLLVASANRPDLVHVRYIYLFAVIDSVVGSASWSVDRWVGAGFTTR